MHRSSHIAAASLIAFATALFIGCGASEPKQAKDTPKVSATTAKPTAAPTDHPKAHAQPAPKPIQMVYYRPGSSWLKGKPPAEQNLAGHMKFVHAAYQQSQLVGHGLATDRPLGLYLVSGQTDAAARFVASDPGVKQNVLQRDHIESWMVMMSQLDKHKPGTPLYVLRYRPGSSWIAGKPLTQQAIGPHMAYAKTKFASGRILAGGPIGDGSTGGAYLVTGTKTELEAFLSEDPGVTAGVFTASTMPWAGSFGSK